MSNTKRDKLIEDHRDYVREIVWASYYCLNFPKDFVDDCIGAANLALVEAAGSYDSSKSCSFKTYVIKRIKGSIIDFLRDISLLKRSGYRKLRTILTLYKREELSAGWYERKAIMEKSAFRFEPKFLRYMAQKQEDRIILDYNSQYRDSDQDEKILEIAGEKISLAKSFDRLSNIQRYVVYSYYFRDKTFDEIAEEFHLSRSWICRIHSSAIDHLRGDLYQ